MSPKPNSPLPSIPHALRHEDEGKAENVPDHGAGAATAVPVADESRPAVTVTASRVLSSREVRCPIRLPSVGPGVVARRAAAWWETVCGLDHKFKMVIDVHACEPLVWGDQVCHGDDHARGRRRRLTGG